jgi:hypothetical protein
MNGALMPIITPNGIILSDDGKPDGHIEHLKELNYEKSDVPLELIDQCQKLYEETGLTHFIFDTEITNFIKSKSHHKDDMRDLRIDAILDEEKFHIGTEDVFYVTLPSRFSYYDTETQLCNRYQRYNYVINFLQKIGFFKKEDEFSIGTNFGPEFEQSFILEANNSDEYFKSIIRVRPNLFISMIINLQGKHEGLHETVYNGFFNKGIILENLKKYYPDFKSIIRDIKLDQIL